MSTSGRQATPTPSVVGGQQRQPPPGPLKVSPPELYYGARDKLDDWLVSLELVFKLSREIHEQEQVLYATTFMRGQAQKWMKPYLKTYLDGSANAEVQTWMTDFDNFKEKIETVFGAANENKVAIRIIQQLKQTRSAAEYTQKFQEYATQTGWDDKALMEMYRRGLKDTVKFHLAMGMTIDEEPTLEDTIKEAIDTDDKLYELAVEKKHSGSHFPRQSQGYGASNFRNKKRSFTDPYGSMPMDLDAMQHKDGPRSRGGRGKFDKRKGDHSKGVCYACGKPGHFKRDCRQKNMVQRQINIMDSTPARASDVQWPIWDDPTLNELIGQQRYLQHRITRVVETVVPIDELVREKERVDQQIENIIRLYDEGWMSVTSEQTEEMERDLEWERQYARQTANEDFPEWEDVELADDELSLGQRSEGETKSEIMGREGWTIYATDRRNYNHELVSPQYCHDKLCVSHKEAKRRFGEMNSMFTECPSYNWTQCTSDYCATHLIDKRAAREFPGHHGTWNRTTRHNQEALREYIYECPQDEWIHCYYDTCKKHDQEKKHHGISRPSKN